jgi:hypothetical protein
MCEDAVARRRVEGSFAATGNNVHRYESLDDVKDGGVKGGIADPGKRWRVEDAPSLVDLTIRCM